MTTAPAPTTPGRVLARRASLWSAGAAALILAAATAVVLSWRDDLPDPVASHWGPGGEADGFSSLTGYVTVVAVVGVASVALFGALCWFLGQAATTRRMMAGILVWFGGFAAALLLLPLGVQRGLADAAGATLDGWLLAAAIVVPVLPGVVAAALVPRDPRQAATSAVPADAQRVALADGERAAWISRATGGTVVWIGAAAVVLTTVTTIVTQTWPMLFLPVLLAGVLAATMVFDVRVDAGGLTVRSALGWPRTHVPVDEVVRASVTQVNAFREFGGYGWRVSRTGRVGIVPRSGDALLVERTGDRSLVVTVPDAATGAALLNTLADRTR